MVKCLQNALLFVIAILLVFGFYYHAEFYKLGWFGLLIIGSIITFSVLKLIIWLSYGKTFKEDFQGVLIFRPEEVEAIKHGRIKQIIRPERKRQIQPGEVYRAKLNIMSESYFSELFIMNIFTKRLKNLSENDIFLTGVKSFQDFRSIWMGKYGVWEPENSVNLIKFEVLN